MKKQKINKGEYGYIDSEKKKQLRRTIIAFSISAAIFILGLALNKWQKSNVFTIIAAVSVLPAAKIMIRYILISPYRTASVEFHKKFINIAGEGSNIFEDAIFTTSEKAMGFSAVAVSDHYVIACRNREKDDKEKLSGMLSKVVKAWGFPHKVIVCMTDEDFFREMKKYSVPEPSKNTGDLIEQLRILIP